MLICSGFGILMSQYGQVNKSCDILGCAKIVFWLHTARTENQDTPQTHPWIPLWYPQTPPTPFQGTKHANRWQTDTNRRRQTPPWHWQGLFEYVWRCRLESWTCCLWSSISWQYVRDKKAWKWYDYIVNHTLKKVPGKGKPFYHFDPGQSQWCWTRKIYITLNDETIYVCFIVIFVFKYKIFNTMCSFHWLMDKPQC